MKKIIAIATAAMLTAASLSGRIARRSLSVFEHTVPETETLGTGTMEFVYDYTHCYDTTATPGEAVDIDLMLLQIGRTGLSKFSSYKNLAVDSMLCSMSSEQIQSAVTDGKLSRGNTMTIYKNYPQGRLTHVDKICSDYLRYDEDMPVQEWKLTDSTTTVAGYECRSAVCDFRGRHWTVFYCEDIPVAEGPWKLCGLPGLIMKAEDAQGHYKFECTGIRSQSVRPITIYKVPFNVTTRHKFYDTLHRFDVNPYAYYEATTGTNIPVVDNAGNIVPGAYDPIELPFDYIERDYLK